MKAKKIIIGVVIIIALVTVLYFTTRPQISIENIDYINKIITFKMSYGLHRVSGTKPFSDKSTTVIEDTFVISAEGRGFVLQIKNKSGVVVKQAIVPINRIGEENNH